MKIYKLLPLLAIALLCISCEDDRERGFRDEPAKEDITVDRTPGMNLVGVVRVNGTPRPGVVVSDGVNVVATNDKGEYQMSSRGRTHVWISLPEDCRIPLDGDGFPKLYRALDANSQGVRQVDFDLEAQPVDNEWTVQIFADTQTSRDSELDRFESIQMETFEPFAKSLPAGSFAINMGDVTWNAGSSLYPRYKQIISRLGIPVFHVIGNHDHNPALKGDDACAQDFKNAFGPNFYSFNRGEWHIVVLDDIDFEGGDASNDSHYTCSVTQEQIDWLKKDLSYVSKEKSILLCVHAPFWRRYNGHWNVTNYDAVLSQLRDFHRTEILAGHVHRATQQDLPGYSNMHETSLPAAMGALWVGPLCPDGTPASCGAMTFRGTELADKYMQCVGYEDAYQMRLYLPEEASYRFGCDGPMSMKQIKMDYETLMVNVFFYDESWTVEVQVDGGAWENIPPEKFRNYLASPRDNRCDPLAVQWFGTLYADGTKMRTQREIDANHNDTANDTVDHTFLYKPSNPDWHTFTVRVTDNFGHVYTSSITNE